MTGLLARGLTWFGLYLAIVLLPLLVALIVGLQDGVPVRLSVGLGTATGVIAFSLMTAEFALVSRLKSASRPFGTDALTYFHRLMGCAALAFVIGHVAVLVAAGLPLSALNPLSGSARPGPGPAALWLALLLVAVSLWRRRLHVRYEWWQATHSAFALVLVLTALVHAIDGIPRRGSDLLVGVLVAYAIVFVALLLYYRLLRPLRLQSRPWQVTENREEGGSTRTLVLQPVGHPGLRFAPGQFAWLSTGRTAFGFGQHPVSLSGSAQAADAAIEFSIKALGDWSGRAVPQLAPGARAFVDGPYGAFSPDLVPAQAFVLIAGGIGIAPMRSMLLTLRDRADPRTVILFHAAHDPGRAIFRQEFMSLSKLMNLTVVPVYEAPPADWTGERGYVTAELLRRHLPADRSRMHFFLCGPPPMMDSVEQALEELHVPAGQVHSERFDLV